MPMTDIRGLFLIAMTGMLAVSPACGESLPFARLDDLRGPYEGVGAAGDAFYIHALGKAGKWPICAYWSSARTERSPLLGFGWSIPALESTFAPLDERRWVFRQPDGFARILVNNTRKSDDVLSGGTAIRRRLNDEDVPPTHPATFMMHQNR